MNVKNLEPHILTAINLKENRLRMSKLVFSDNYK